MITKRTVLILGAGVSKPYGFPIGSELVQDIYTQIISQEWLRTLSNFDFKQSEIDEFRSELYQSQIPTIDTFLELRPEFRNIGKIAIALSLLAKENPDNINDFKVRDTGIYHYLFDNLRTDLEKLGQNKLSIITFNYDRSLEYFLFTTLKHGYGITDEAVAGILNSNIPPIVHVHGSLGLLTWQAPAGSEYFPLFKGEAKPYEIGRRLKYAMDSIKVVSDNAPQEFILAKELIRTAESIYFLGFGYDETNLERLGLTDFNFVDRDFRQNYMNPRYSSIHFRGSAMGLGKQRAQSIQNNWRIWLPDRESHGAQIPERLR